MDRIPLTSQHPPPSEADAETSLWGNGQSAHVFGIGRGRGVLLSNTQETIGISSTQRPPTVLSREAETGAGNQETSRSSTTRSSDPEEDFDLGQLEVVSSIPSDDRVSKEGVPENRAHVPRLPSSYYRRRENRPARSTSTESEIIPEPSLAPLDNCGLPKIPCRVILRGVDVYHPYEDMNAFPLLQLVRKALEKQHIDTINELQRVAWPHVLKGRHCFIVGGASPKQGKTLSYLVPIAAKVVKDADIIKRGSETGPIGIILCSCQASGRKIEGHLEDLLRKQGIDFYLGVRSDTNFKKALSENPEILICTPDFLLFVNDRYPSLLGFHRLRYMIVDDCHILHEEHQDSLKRVLELLSYSLERTDTRKYSIQFVFCGTDWNEMMKEQCEVDSPFGDPVLIISSFPQALVYGNIKLQLLLTDDNGKLNRLAEIIKSGVSNDFVVVCQHREMAAKIGIFLYRREGICCTYFEEDDELTVQEQYAKLHETWSNRPVEQTTVLITTDDDLQELRLNKVTHIFHFELPRRKQDAFGERHVCMWSFFPDLNSVRTESLHQKLRSYVLLSPDDPELVRVVGFMKTLNADVPNDLQAIVDMNTENSLRSAELCDGIRVKGKCNAADKRKCQRIYRHFFTKEELEAESTIPKFVNGRVDLKILETKDLNQYIARVLNFYQVKNGSKVNNISYEEMLSKRNSDLATFYEMESNRKPLPDPYHNLGRLGAIKYVEDDGTEFYTRAKATGILPETNPRLRLWCVDIGVHQTRLSNLLYTLPPELETLPPLTTRVIIADLKPLQNEEEYRSNWRGWGENTIDVVKKTLTGPVSLAVNDIIWVQSLCEWERTSTGDWVNKLDLRKEFVRKRHVAESNPDHLKTLYKLCEDNGFSCGMYKALETIGDEFQTMDDNYDWAFIKTSSPDRCSVAKSWSTCIVSPDQMYIVQTEFTDQLDKLITELNEEIDALIQEKPTDYEKQFLNHYEVGLCVAAKDLDDLWARAIITNRVDDETDGMLFDMFFVDHGDQATSLTLKELFPLPKKFVRRLPFQAVAVRLDHIEPIETEEAINLNSGSSRAWEVSATKFLQDVLIKEGQASMVDIVATSKILKKLENDPICAYYNAFVLPPFNALESQADQASEIGEILVSNQLAKRKQDAWEVWESTKSAFLRMLNEVHDKANMGSSESSDYENETDSQEDDAEQNYTSYLGNDSEFMNQMLETMGLQIPKESVNGPAQLSQVQGQTSDPHPFNSKNTSGGVSDQGPSPCTSPVDASAVPGAKVPTVIWRQTKTHLTIQICLTDIKNHSLTLDEVCRTISFQSIDPEGYAFNIKLFAKVNSQPLEIPGGQYLLVKLEKLSHGKWENITATKSPRWLKADLDNVSHSENSDENEEPEDDVKPNTTAVEQELDKKKTEDIYQFANIEEDVGRQGARPESDSEDSISSDEDITMD